MVDTGHVWWRLLPQILGIYWLGRLGSELTLRVSVIFGDIRLWLAMTLFAFNFLGVLVAAVLILNLAGPLRADLTPGPTRPPREHWSQ